MSARREVQKTKTGIVYEVIDGQQRLATFMIAISLIIKGFEDMAKTAQRNKDIQAVRDAKKYAKETRKKFLEYNEDENSQERKHLRVRLSKVDNGCRKNHKGS